MSNVRIATVDDIDALVQLRRSLMEHFGWAAGAGSGDVWVTTLREHLERRIPDGTIVAAIVLGDAGDALAGGIAELIHRLPSPALPNGRIAHVSSMYTKPDVRGQGHGRAIVRCLVQELHGRGVSTIELYAASPEAEALYRSEGFDTRPGGLPMRHSSRGRR